MLAEYGKDLTFSVPLLALATASGFFEDTEAAWRGMPRFPFEAAVLPEGMFKYMNLPVVSYAIPALICVGLAQLNHTKEGFIKSLRSLAVKKALRVLEATCSGSEATGGRRIFGSRAIDGILRHLPMRGWHANASCNAKSFTVSYRHTA